MAVVSRIRVLWGSSLVGRFAVLSALSIGILGLALNATLSRMTAERTLENAEFAARLVANLGIKAHMSPDDFASGDLSIERVWALDEVFRSKDARERIARIKIWDTDGRILYSDDHAHIGEISTSEELVEALAGTLSTEIETGGDSEDAAETTHGDMLEVYVPIEFAGEEATAGAFEVYMPYEPIAAGIASDARTLATVAAAGLLVLWVVLFRIVHQSARRERRHAAELVLQSERNEYLALHDVLTALPNRSLFHSTVGTALEDARQNGTQVAVMIMDLDRFKELNDTLGHHHGDELLKKVGSRLRAVVTADNAVARLGGDEFSVLVAGIESTDDALRVAHAIDLALEEPFEVEGLEIDGRASIGIALFPDHGTDVDTLIQHADTAMYLAKESHLAVQVYAADLDCYTPDRLAMVGELRRAIEAGDLTLFYQPKIDLRTGRVVGVEGLARWIHAERGIVPPDEFIPLAERTGLIRELTRTVLRTALLQHRTWSEQGLDLPIAINISARNLLDGDLPGDVGVLLGESGCEPRNLELEITESTIMADPARAQSVLQELSSMGIALAIDDFGTGYSSLSYLKDLPVRALKIDKSFVLQMVEDTKDDAIVRSTIDLSRNLGLSVIAEGVETDSTRRRLESLGCDLAQGYFFARPLPAPELYGWLVEHRVTQRVHRVSSDRR